jgi:hypothetical protein
MGYRDYSAFFTPELIESLSETTPTGTLTSAVTDPVPTLTAEEDPDSSSNQIATRLGVSPTLIFKSISSTSK